MIEISGLTFSYKKQTPLFRDLNYQIDTGESIGLVGNNGSGKSTLMKIMLSIITPDHGKVLYNDKNIARYRRQLMKKIGIIWGQRTSLWWDLSVKENIYQAGYLFNLTKKEIINNLEPYSKYFRIKDIWDKELRKTSYGQRILTDIIAVLIRKPNVIFFDEAFVGLDHNIKNSIFEILKHYQKDNPECIYIITSHNFDDIVALCHKVACLKDGKISEYQIETLLKTKYTEVILEARKPLDLALFKGYEVTTLSNKKISLLISGSLNIIFQKLDWDTVTNIEIIDKTLDIALKNIIAGNERT